MLDGRVKLSINSSDGRRIILGIARPGEIIGLSSAISGHPYVITAEAQFPCLLTSIQRHVFLDFLMRYPVAGQNVMLELSSEYSRTALQLRTLGLIITAPARLVRLLLDWSKEGERTKNGARIQCSLTQTEIGEHIGVSRETITRTLKDFENQGLIERRGSTLIVPNIAALESCEYAI